MTRRPQQLRQALLVALTLFIGGMLTVTPYALWRLRVEAVNNGLNEADMHVRSVEDFLTQKPARDLAGGRQRRAAGE